MILILTQTLLFLRNAIFFAAFIKNEFYSLLSTRTFFLVEENVF